MKLCPSCNKTKPIDQFSKNTTRKSGTNYSCKECHSNYRKEHYQQNKKKYIKKAIKFKKKELEKFKLFKATLKCKICSESESICLDFHHLDPSKKEYTISYLRSISFKSTLKEIEKCIVLCSNCHRKVHAGIIQLVE